MEEINAQELLKKENPNLTEVTEVKSQDDIFLRNNRFLVTFSGSLKQIPHWIVKAIRFNRGQRYLNVMLCDTLINGQPLPQLLESFTDSKENGLISIQITHLDPTGLPIYTEIYHRISLSPLSFSELNYDDDRIRTVSVYANYASMDYGVPTDKE